MKEYLSGVINLLKLENSFLKIQYNSFNGSHYVHEGLATLIACGDTQFLERKNITLFKKISAKSK